MSYTKDYMPNSNYGIAAFQERYYNTNFNAYLSNQENFIKTTESKPSKRKKLCKGSSKFVKTFTPTNGILDTTFNAMDSTDVTHSSIVTEPITGTFDITNNNYIIEHLDLSTFKVKPCTITTQHNHKRCHYYHNQKDRKRPGNFYSSELCEYVEKENLNCINGDNCPKAHNGVEQLYRADKYKTKFCTYYPNNLSSCEYGVFCSFAHSENDIVTELIHNYEFDDDFYLFHFKTVWCPFNLTQHDKALCVYAHNWQDYRRKPHIYNYDPVPCPNWKSTDFIVNYEDGCYLKENCKKCHGWKESEYHPLNYKTKACPAGKNCQKIKDCPHFHNIRERRNINTNIGNKIFRYIPRNRIVSNTFKIRHGDKINQNQKNNISNYYYNQNINTTRSNNYISNTPQMVYNSDYEETTFIFQETSLNALNNISTNHQFIQEDEELVNEQNIIKSILDGQEVYDQYQNINFHSANDIDFIRPKIKLPQIDPIAACTLSFDKDKMFKELLNSPGSLKSNYESNLALNHDSREEIHENHNNESPIMEKDYDENDYDIRHDIMLDKILENDDVY